MERSCTDVLMCLIFFVFFLGMFATAGYGYSQGNPMRLITPFDSAGNQCGSNGKLESYEYLYWPKMFQSLAGSASSLNVSMSGFSNINITAKMFGDTVCVK